MSGTSALAFALLTGNARAGANQDDEFPEVHKPAHLRFPRDHGAHPDFRTEWWYLTGWLDQGSQPLGSQPLGFQVTFFRSRTVQSRANPSRFSASQLLFAHVALASTEIKALEHDQRSARVGFGHASFAGDKTDLRLGDWRFWQTDANHYQSIIHAKSFSLELDFETQASAWRQGEDGYSRKGPQPKQASYYYSRPQLSVRARLQWTGKPKPRSSKSANGSTGLPATDGMSKMTGSRTMTGVAWLDHEWSSQVLDSQASGWDWVGLNLDNGDALMAFQIRRTGNDARAPNEALWRQARLRRADYSTRDFGDAIRFNALRWWQSARTSIRYPVEMALEFGDRRLILKPLFDDQELDSRQSTGAIYWEGAVSVFENGQVVGRGYLELTGYGERLRL